jgi:hypothetical protein
LLADQHDLRQALPRSMAIARGRVPEPNRRRCHPRLRLCGAEPGGRAVVLLSHADSFEQAILAAANLGDDADTTAAVCGQVAGASLRRRPASPPPGWSGWRMRAEIEPVSPFNSTRGAFSEQPCENKTMPAHRSSSAASASWHLLEAHLAQALAGQGHIVLVQGEAGQGKTALLLEFTRRAQTQHPGLLVAVGDCSAQTGAGEPYHPFPRGHRPAGRRLRGQAGPRAASPSKTSAASRRRWPIPAWC